MKILDQTSKTNWKFLAIVAVLGLLAGGVMLILQNSLYQPQPIQVSQPQIQKPAPKETQPQEKTQEEVDISDWQTYRNDEFGFEVRYPHTRYQECAPKIFSSLSREERTKTLSFVGMSLNLIDANGLKLNEFVTQYRNKLISELRPMEGKHGSYWGQNPGLPTKTSLGGREALEVVSNFVGAYPDTIYDIFVKQDEKIFIFSFSTKSIHKSGCVTEPTDKYKPEALEALARQILSTFRFIDQKMQQANDQNSCEKQGGKWQKAGAVQGFMCIFTYADGGKECKSSDECEGDCIVTQDSQTTGFCKQNTDPFGCFSTIESVKKGNGILCRD